LVGSTWNSHATTYLAAHATPDEHIDITPLFLAAEAALRQEPGRDALQRLCQALAAFTHEKAVLRLHASSHPRMNRPSLPPGARSLPVQYHHRAYGTLIIHPTDAQPDQPALSDSFAQRLAHLCGMLLFLLEQAALIEMLSRHLAEEVVEPLTPRQQEVLALIAQGRNDEEIVESLCISSETLPKHRLEIYQRLGVHKAEDVLLAAYHAQLFSFLAPSPKKQAK
jgi:DNA-binding CsgD family transcriptional regulator